MNTAHWSFDYLPHLVLAYFAAFLAASLSSACLVVVVAAVVVVLPRIIFSFIPGLAQWDDVAGGGGGDRGERKSTTPHHCRSCFPHSVLLSLKCRREFHDNTKRKRSRKGGPPLH